MKDSLRVKDVTEAASAEEYTVKINESGGKGVTSKKKGANLVFREMFADAFLRRKVPLEKAQEEVVKQKMPSPYLYLRALVMYVILFIITLSVFFLFNGYEMYPILVALLVTFVPVVLGVFFYEMDTSGRLSIYNVLLLFFFSASCAMAIRFISTRFIYEMGGEAISVFGAMAIGLMEAAVVATLCFVFIRQHKVKDVITGVLIGAVIGAGFAAVNNVEVSFSAAFVGTEYVPLYQVVIYNETLVDSLNSIFSVTLFDLMLRGANYVFASAVFVGVAVYALNRKKREKTPVVLLALVCVLYWAMDALWIINFTSEIFVYILRGLMTAGVLLAVVRTVRTGLLSNVYE